MNFRENHLRTKGFAQYFMNFVSYIEPFSERAKFYRIRSGQKREVQLEKSSFVFPSSGWIFVQVMFALPRGVCLPTCFVL